MGISYNFSELDFAGMSAKVLARVPQALASGMEIIRADSAARVPVESGDLLGSANVQVVDMVGTISYDGPYARYQEFGVFFRKPDKYGGPLRHTHGTSFFLTVPMIVSADAALEEVRRVMFP